jgi:predicted enzyme related to lactoylglutathione lyase
LCRFYIIFNPRKPAPQTKISDQMNKTSIFILGLLTSFCFGFAFKTVIAKHSNSDTLNIKKVTGIGGIFFKCKDPKQVREWYKTHLGIDAGPYGANFQWRQDADPAKKGSTQWTPFSEKTKYFDPSTKDFMINYRVGNLKTLVEQLKSEGVTIVDTIEGSDYGKFVHIIDVEGNKVELWEPVN